MISQCEIFQNNIAERAYVPVCLSGTSVIYYSQIKISISICLCQNQVRAERCVGVRITFLEIYYLMVDLSF